MPTFQSIGANQGDDGMLPDPAGGTGINPLHSSSTTVPGMNTPAVGEGGRLSDFIGVQFDLAQQAGIPDILRGRTEQNQRLLDQLMGKDPFQFGGDTRQSQLDLADRLIAQSKEARESKAAEMLQQLGEREAGAQQAQILGTRGVDPALARRIAQSQGAQAQASLQGRLQELQASEALAEQRRQDALRQLAGQALSQGRQQDLSALGQDVRSQAFMDELQRGFLGLQTGLTQAGTGLVNQLILGGGQQAANVGAAEDQLKRARTGAIFGGLGAAAGSLIGGPVGGMVGGQLGSGIGQGVG